jgi:hypothetical protein
MNEFGFRLLLRESKLILDAQRNRGAEKWNELIEEILGFEIRREWQESGPEAKSQYHLERLPQLFAFGYYSGSEICRLIGGSENQCREAGIISSQFNVFCSLFDKVCDDHSEMLQELVSIVNSSSIIAEIDGTQKMPSQDSDERSPLILRIVIRALREYFTRIRLGLDGATRAEKLKEELCRSMLDAYENKLLMLQIL